MSSLRTTLLIEAQCLICQSRMLLGGARSVPALSHERDFDMSMLTLECKFLEKGGKTNLRKKHYTVRSRVVCRFNKSPNTSEIELALNVSSHLDSISKRRTD